MESKKLFNIFNNKNKSTTTSTSSTVSTKIDVAQNISVSIITATNTNIVNSDDESNTNNTPSGYLDLGDLNSGPMRPILKVSVFFKFPFLIVLVIIYIYAIFNFKL